MFAPPSDGKMEATERMNSIRKGRSFSIIRHHAVDLLWTPIFKTIRRTWLATTAPQKGKADNA
jgi:hypothetical protein